MNFRQIAMVAAGVLLSLQAHAQYAEVPQQPDSTLVLTLDDALKASTEPWFVKRIYGKLNEKLRAGNQSSAI